MRKIIASLLWNLLSGTALCEPKTTLRVRAVEIVPPTVVDTPKEFSIDIQCGERLAGMLIRETSNRVGVAAVVERPDVQCSSTPVTRVFSLPFFSSKPFEVISLPLSEGDHKVNLQEATLSTAGGALSVQWENTCRNFVGAVLLPDQNGRISVAAAFSKKEKGAKTSACAGGLQTMKMSSVNMTAATWEALKRPGDVEDMYAIRVVAPQKVIQTSEGQWRATWEGHCREIPLGLLLTGTGRSKVGVVTAYFPNIQCDTKSKFLRNTDLNGELDMAPGTLVSALSVDEARVVNQESYSLRLAPIQNAEFSKPRGLIKLSINSSCGASHGIVVGADASGNPSIAHLESASARACAVAWHQQTDIIQLQARGELNPKLFPLKVKGSAVR